MLSFLLQRTTCGSLSLVIDRACFLALCKGFIGPGFRLCPREELEGAKMPALQGVTPVCCCPASALVVPAPSGLAAFWAWASPLHTQMALHGVQPSVSTKPAGAVG